MKKEKLGKILLGLLIMAALSGCEKKGSVAKEANLVFSHWNTNQNEAMIAVAEAFEAQNPGVRVEVQLAPWSEYWTKLEAAFVSGKAPDTYALHTNFAESYVRNNVVLQLDDLKDYDSDFDYGNYPEGITNLYKFDGKHYAVPKDMDCIILAYNKELFNQAGVAYPDGSWTWDDINAAADKITALGDDLYGFGAYNNPQAGWGSFIYQNGGYVISPDGSKSGMALPESIEAVKFYTDMFLNSDRSPNADMFAETDRRAMFAQGKLGMLPTGNWQLTYFTDNEDISDKFDIAPLPKGAKKATIMNGLGWAGAASTRFPDETKKLIAFMGSRKGNEIATIGAAIPAYNGVAQMWVEKHSDIYDAEIILESLKNGVQYGGSLEKPRWEPVMFDYMDKIFLGQMSVEEGMKKIGEEMDAIING